MGNSSDWLITYTVFCCKAKSASRQDELNPALWLAPEQARWNYLAHSGLPAVSCKKIDCSLCHKITPLLTKLLRSKNAWILASSSFACLWTWTVSWPISSHLVLRVGQQPIYVTISIGFIFFWIVCFYDQMHDKRSPSKCNHSRTAPINGTCCLSNQEMMYVQTLQLHKYKAWSDLLVLKLVLPITNHIWHFLSLYWCGMD